MAWSKLCACSGDAAPLPRRVPQRPQQHDATALRITSDLRHEMMLTWRTVKEMLGEEYLTPKFCSAGKFFIHRNFLPTEMNQFCGKTWLQKFWRYATLESLHNKTIPLPSLTASSCCSLRPRPFPLQRAGRAAAIVYVYVFLNSYFLVLIFLFLISLLLACLQELICICFPFACCLLRREFVSRTWLRKFLRRKISSWKFSTGRNSGVISSLNSDIAATRKFWRYSAIPFHFPYGSFG